MFIYTPIHVYIYTYLLLKIYNQIEDAVHRICLLVPQDINSVQKLCICRLLLQWGYT